MKEVQKIGTTRVAAVRALPAPKQVMLSGRNAHVACREPRCRCNSKKCRVIVAVALFLIIFFRLSGRFASDEDEHPGPHWRRIQDSTAAGCAQSIDFVGFLPVDSAKASYPDATTYLEKVNARITKTRSLTHQTHEYARFWYVNESGIWSLESRIQHGQHDEEITECGHFEPIQCPSFPQNSHVGEKNWYTSNRTAHQVMHGLQENARMLSTIQSLSGVQFVVMYGSLIGQWWNGQSLPWDTDMDVHILEVEAFQTWLAVQERMKFPQGHSEDNLEVTYYKLPDANFTLCFDSGPQHHIEFRLIHIPTGVYTDIMSISLTSDPKVLAWKVESRPVAVKVPAFAMKASFNKLGGGNLHNEEDITPLSPCEFNGVVLFCPRKISSVLRQKFPHFDDMSWYQRNMKAWFNETIGLLGCWDQIQ